MTAVEIKVLRSIKTVFFAVSLLATGDPSKTVAQAIATPTIPAPTVGMAANRAGADPFETEVTALEARLAKSGLAPGPIVFYGSSSIRLWKSLAEDFPDYPVLNCGFGGSRLSDCARYASRLVFPRKPSAVVIYAGDNDIAVGVEPEKAFQTFKQLFGIFRNYSALMPIAFVSVKPSPARCGRLENIRKFNQLVEDYLEKKPETDFIDIFSDMLGPDQRPVPSLFVTDQIHLSPAGYEILRREVGEFLQGECAKRTSIAPR